LKLVSTERVEETDLIGWKLTRNDEIIAVLFESRSPQRHFMWIDAGEEETVILIFCQEFRLKANDIGAQVRIVNRSYLPCRKISMVSCASEAQRDVFGQLFGAGGRCSVYSTQSSHSSSSSTPKVVDNRCLAMRFSKYTIERFKSRWIEEDQRLLASYKGDLVMKQLREKDIKLIQDHWPYHIPGSSYLYERIARKGLPSLGLYLNKNHSQEEDQFSLIGWIFTHSDRSMGGLHILDEYRGKGFARLLQRSFMIQLLYHDPRKKEFERLGLWGHFDENNEASIILSQSLGAVNVARVSWLRIIHPSEAPPVLSSLPLSAQHSRL